MISAAVARAQTKLIGKVYRECPICESPHLQYEFLVEGSPVCGCQDCGLLFLNPQPQSLSDQNEAPYLESESLANLHTANAAERIQQLVAYSGMHSGALLLIGADGYLATEGRKAGFDVISLTVAEFQSDSRNEISGSANACVLFCALERMADPLDALLRVRRILAPNGCLMVISPTSDSKTARLLRSSWWEFNRQNLFYFSTDTLQNLLVKAGFGDAIIEPDRTLISLNYARRRLAAASRGLHSYRWLRRLMSLSPVLQNKTFRLLYGRTRFFVRPKPAPSRPLLSVIVPVYNEEPTFPYLIEQLLVKTLDGIDIEVVIVESNSTDGSREAVLRYRNHSRVRIILEPAPMGKGHAVRAGLEAANGTLILFQDADLEYDINDYDGLVAPLVRFQSNFVLGSRHSGLKNSWKVRRFSDSPGLAAFFNFGHLVFLTLFNVLYSQRLSDPFTMFKVFRRDCLYGLKFECNRFDFDYEIVIKLLRKGYRALELPVNYQSRSIKEGKKVTVFRDPLTWIRALLKFRNSPLYARRT